MIPALGLAKLSKGLVQITGLDSAKFLNGLVTTRFLPNIIKKNQYTISDVEFKHVNLNKIIDLNENWGVMHEDMYDPNNEILIRRDGVNSMFMNAKGRVISDSFLYPIPFQLPPKHNDQSPLVLPSYMVEVDHLVVKKLSMLMQMHKLTSDITFESREDLHSYYYYNDSIEFDDFCEYLQETYFNTYTPRDANINATKFLNDEMVVNKQHGSSILGFAIDNRIPNFGLKFITDKPIDNDFFSDRFKAQFEVLETLELAIDTRRVLNGLYESKDSPPNFQLLPFDMNLDYINGLSLDKGCYVGQELTIRSYNSGVIRKRIVPVQFFDLTDENLQKLAENDDLQVSNDDPVTKVLSSIDTTELDKLKVTKLAEDRGSNQTELNQTESNSPFGKSSKPVTARRPTVGKILSINNNLGFLLINLGELKKQFFKVEIPGVDKPLGIKVSKPSWWPEDEDEE